MKTCSSWTTWKSKGRRRGRRERRRKWKRTDLRYHQPQKHLGKRRKLKKQWYFDIIRSIWCFCFALCWMQRLCPVIRMQLFLIKVKISMFLGLLFASTKYHWASSKRTCHWPSYRPEQYSCCHGRIAWIHGSLSMLNYAIYWTVLQMFAIDRRHNTVAFAISVYLLLWLVTLMAPWIGVRMHSTILPVGDAQWQVGLLFLCTKYWSIAYTSNDMSPIYSVPSYHEALPVVTLRVHRPPEEWQCHLPSVPSLMLRKLD